LEAYALTGEDWREIGRFAGRDRISVAPFDAIAIDLADLWMPEEDEC
jgi:hypothetical protein